MTAAPTADYSLFPLGDFQLQSGQTIPDAHIAYRTWGTLTPSTPVILYPTWYSGTITAGNEWLVSTAEHPRRALDPQKYFIVVPALFGNGESSSPSNHPLGCDMPKATFYDNVRAQHRLLTEGLGITKLRLVTGWSMGAGQTYQWAAQYPDMVELAAPFCGSARTSFHNQVFIDSYTFPIKSDPAWNNGKYASQPLAGLKGLGHVYAGWGFSQSWYRQRLYASHFGHASLGEHLEKFWEAWATSKDANNMLYMAWTWLHGDISAQPRYAPELFQSQSQLGEGGGGGDKAGPRLGARGRLEATLPEDDQAFERALQGIKAKCLLMPGRHDLYFPPEDTVIEARIMGPKAKMVVIESIWGHWAGGPGDSKEDAKFIDDHLAAFLEEHEAELAGGQ